MNDLADPVFDVVGLSGVKCRATALLMAFTALSIVVFYVISLFLHYVLRCLD